MKPCRIPFFQTVAITASLALTAGQMTYAATYTGTTSNVWGVTTNWSPNDIPDTVSESAVFDGSLSRTAITVSGTNIYTIGQMKVISPSQNIFLRGATSDGGKITLDPTSAFSGVGFDMSTATKPFGLGTTNSWTLALGASQQWNINSATAGASLKIADGNTNAAKLTFDLGAYTLTANVGVETGNPSGSLLQIGGIGSGGSSAADVVVVGTGGIAKIGAGILTLDGPNTFSGGILINEGRVLNNHNSGAGTGTVTLNATGTEFQLGQGLSGMASTLLVADTDDGKTLRFYDATGTSPSVFSGQITINETTSGNFETQVGDGATLTISGKITGSGGAGLKKTNPGTLVLASNLNNYAGLTAVNAGTLDLTGNVPGATTVAVGATLQGTGTATGDVTVSGKITGGNAGAPGGTIHLGGNLTLSGGTLGVTLPGAGGNSSVQLAGGTVSVTGSPVISLSGTPVVGSYTLISGASSAAPISTAGITVTGAGLLTATLDNSVNGTLVLHLVDASLIWNGTSGNSTWDIGVSSNWAGPSAFTNGKAVIFDDTAAEKSVTLNTAVAPSAVVVNNSTGNDYAVSGTGGIGGAASLTKKGAGQLTLATTNSYTGATTVEAGTLAVGGGNAIPDTGALSIAAGSTLMLNASETIATLSGSYTANLQGHALTAGGDNASTTFSGSISGTGGSLVKTGTGTLTLTGTGTQTGGAVVSQGTVVANTNTCLGTSGTLTLNDANTGANNTSLVVQPPAAGDLNLTNPITVTNHGTGTTTLGSNRTGSGRTFFDGEITLNKDLTLTGTLSDRTHYRGGIRGTGNLTVTGGQRTTFSDSTASTESTEGAALYDFAGNLTLTGTGTKIQINSDIELTHVGTVTVDTGATLQSAYSKTLRINGLSGSGTLTSLAGSGTFVVGIGGATSTFDGVIAVNGTNVTKLTKEGSGTFTLTGSNTYTGATAVNGGTLKLGKASAIMYSTSITVAPGATLDGTTAGFSLFSGQILSAGDGSPGNDVTGEVGSAGIIRPGGNGSLGTITGITNLTIGGPVEWDRSAGSTACDTLAINGTLTIVAGFNLVPAALGVPAPGTRSYTVVSGITTPLTPADIANLPILPDGYTWDTASDATALKVTHVQSGTNLTWAGAPGGNWNTTDANWTGGTGIYQDGDFCTLDDSAAGATIIEISDADVNPGSVTVANTLAKDYTIKSDLAWGIAGSTSLIKTGNGLLNLLAYNTYTGGTTLSGGIISFGSNGLGTGAVTMDGGTLRWESGNIQGVPISLAAGKAATLDTNGNDVNLPVGIAGSTTGSLVKIGGGTLGLSAAATYTGGTTVNAGTLSLNGGGGVAGTLRGAVTVNSGATLRLNAGDVTGYGTTNQVTSINVNGGTMDVGVINNQTLGNCSITLTGGAITGVANSNLDFFQGASSLASAASAVTSTVSGPKIAIRQTTGLTVAVADGAADEDLVIHSVIRTNGTAYASSPLTKTGAGKLVLNGLNTYTGNTVVNGGTLELGSLGSLRFVVTNTANNKITGTGSVNLNGSFDIDTSATTVTSGSWTLVDTGTLTENFGTFAISGTGWSETSNVWTKPDGNRIWTFTEATGVLTVAPSNNFASWMGGYDFSAFPGADLGATGDADQDGISNLVEHVLGTAPNAATTGLTVTSGAAGSVTFQHPLNANLASDVTYAYQWSADLAEWKASGQSNTGGINATIIAGAPVSGVVTVTTTATAGSPAKLFTRLVATKAE